MNNKKKVYPPALSRKLLQWFCKDELVEEIEGDLEEEFNNRVASIGKVRASLIYFFQVVSFLKPFATKKSSTKNNNVMWGIFKNYFLVSFRGVYRDRGNTIISIFGLSIALASAAVIYLVTSFERGYDSFHSKADRIYRVNYDARMDPGRNYILPTVGPPLGPAIKETYPEVEDAVRFRATRSTIMATEDGSRSFYEDKVIYADPSIFNIFDYPLSVGDQGTALSNPNQIVLTKETATRYFGNSNPLDQIILYGNEPFFVTGVLEDIPKNSHFEFSAIIPFEAFKVPFGYPVTLEDWGWISFHVYVLLDKDARADILESKLPQFAAQHFEGERSAGMRYRLQPLKDIYFGEVKHERIASGNYTYILILYTVGIMILMLAAFNFTNMSLARTFSKAKETGIRKALGTHSAGLWIRYVSEPVLISVLAAILAGILVFGGVEFIGLVFGISLELTSDFLFSLLPGMLLTSALIGILAGLYPSMLMSRYNPVVVLKGANSKSGQGMGIRKFLVTFQFVITSFLIAGSLIVAAQINLLRTKDLGYDKDNILLLRLPGDVLTTSFPEFRSELVQLSGISNVSVGGGRMDAETGNVPIFKEGSEDPVNLPINGVREEFFETIGADMAAGREFKFEFPGDSSGAIIINESAAKTFGWSAEEALGKRIRVFDLAEGEVIGVVNDFNFTSLHFPMSPLVITYPRTHLTDLFIRLSPNLNRSEILSEIEAKHRAIFPGVPFDYTFMNDNLEKLYATDVRFADLVKGFTFLTIIIAILGLYGLIVLVSQQRIKEISIRKILGAKLGALIFELSKSFLGLIFLANLIAFPLGYFIADNWVNNFAYQINISWIFFAIPLAITLAVASLVLFWQTLKVAVVNPVKTLRHE